MAEQIPDRINPDGDEIVKVPGRIRFKTVLMEKVTGTIIFEFPEGVEESEKIGDLQAQVLRRLVQFSNMHNSYMKGIEVTQHYLKSLCFHCPEDKPWIVRAADAAGEEFLKLVTEVRLKKFALKTTIERGEMFLGIKHIGGC